MISYPDIVCRRDDGLWDPSGRPPSGRGKPPPAKPQLPPRFLKSRLSREAEPLQTFRRNQDTSQLSDWSLEMEEEEEEKAASGTETLQLYPIQYTYNIIKGMIHQPTPSILYEFLKVI